LPGVFIDSILIASHIIVALQQIVSRLAPPTVPTVLSFGKIIGNGSTNIIPDEVKIEGTFRTSNEEWRQKAHDKIRKLACEIAGSMDATCDVRIAKGYPSLYNDPVVTEKIRNFSEQYLDKENIIDLNARMTSDDFSYFSEALPSSYFRTGVGNKSKNITSQLHTSKFNIDEDTLKLSTGLMSWIAISFLTD
jgi:amidohydrolase